MVPTYLSNIQSMDQQLWSQVAIFPKEVSRAKFNFTFFLSIVFNFFTCLHFVAFHCRMDIGIHIDESQCHRKPTRLNSLLSSYKMLRTARVKAETAVVSWPAAYAVCSWGGGGPIAACSVHFLISFKLKILLTSTMHQAKIACQRLCRYEVMEHQCCQDMLDLSLISLSKMDTSMCNSEIEMFVGLKRGGKPQIFYFAVSVTNILAMMFGKCLDY